MNAVVVESFGAPLKRVDRDITPPAAGEVQIRIEAIGLNWSDVLQRDGNYPGGPKPPFVAGQEAAGIVVEHGAGVSSPPIGARVSAIGRGLGADLANVPANSVIEWGDAIDMDQRAALPISLLTAHYALVTMGRAQRGETVLVLAAAGGLGHITTQIGHALGMRVIGACSASKREHVIGADVVCDYSEIADKGPVDVVIDGVGGDAYRDSMKVLRPGGRMVIVGAASGQLPTVDMVKLLWKSHAVIGAHLKNLFAEPALLRHTVAACVELAKTVRARVVTMPVGEIEHAYRRLALRQISGKLVVTL